MSKSEKNKQLVQLKNIVKEYPGVTALNNVTISFEAGEVHAIMGENGAGKSTLIKVLSGSIPYNSGEIYIDGTKIEEMNPIEASRLGIQVIYQELNLIRGMSVMDNIFVGITPRKMGFIVDKETMYEKSTELFEMMDIVIDPNSIVHDLPIAYQQIVEIAKALVRNPRLLIMDEPTSLLTNNEVETLFKVIGNLKKNGVTILYISHRLEEIFEIADRVSVLRDGEYIKTSDVQNETRQSLISSMVGRELSETYPSRLRSTGQKVVEAKNISGVGFSDVSFDLHQGEILGISGLVGSGRTELAKGIFGATRIKSGELYVNKELVNYNSPSDAINSGIAYLPEDRKDEGLFLNLSTLMNIEISSLSKFSSLGVISQRKSTENSTSFIQYLGVKTANPKFPVRTLSGGNQQKVVLAKWLSVNSNILIFDEPTRGIDVGSKQEIYQLISDLVEEGKAVIMISSDMEELLGMSDRILVMFEGQQVGRILDSDEFNDKLIMQYSSGIEEVKNEYKEN